MLYSCLEGVENDENVLFLGGKQNLAELGKGGTEEACLPEGSAHCWAC